MPQRDRDKKKTADSYHNEGVAYGKLGKYSEAIRVEMLAFQLRREMGERKGVAESYNFLGEFYRRQGNYAEAMQDHLSALKIHESINDTNGIAYSHQNIGIIYILQENYPEALKHLSTTLKMQQALNNKKGIADAYGNLGWYYGAQIYYDESLNNTYKALKIFEEIRDTENMALYYNNLGYLYKQKHDYKNAMSNLLIAVKLSGTTGDRNNIAETYETIGETYAAMNNETEALSWLHKGLEIANEISSKRIVKENYLALSKVYARLSDYKTAYHYQNLYTEIKELMDNESSRQVAAMQMKYETEKKNREIQLLQKNKALKEEEAREEKIIKNTFIGGFMMTLLLAFLLYKRFSDKKAANLILASTNNTLHSTLENLKSTQAQLVQSEKMASLGRLTAGIAHEIQNPLNFVNNFSEVSADLVDEFMNANDNEERKEIGRDLKENLNKINEHGKRADGIVKIMQKHVLEGTGYELFEEKTGL